MELEDKMEIDEKIDINNLNEEIEGEFDDDEDQDNKPNDSQKIVISTMDIDEEQNELSKKENENNNKKNNLPIENNLNEKIWFDRFVEDFGIEMTKKRPSVVPWYQYYLRNLNFNEREGINFFQKSKKLIQDVLSDSITTLQELILEGDVENVKFQIERMSSMYETDFDLEEQNSLIQYSVLGGNKEIIDVLLSYNGGKYLLNKGDLITGFTGLHVAFFVQNVSMIEFLLRRGANWEKLDKFSAKPIEYCKLMRGMPILSPKIPAIIKIFDATKKMIVEKKIADFEKEQKFTFIPYLICTSDYIFELMFSGFSVAKADQEFRKKYFPLIYESSGDENIILSKINENIGYGAFAAKNFQKGDFIVRYNGCLTLSEKIIDKSFNMDSGIEGIGLDGSKFRNLAGFINHSENSNAESQCVVDRGAEQALIIATKDIKKGDQIFINYSRKFWTQEILKDIKMEKIEDYFSKIEI